MTTGRLPGPNGIQPTIVNAKGDLIVGTADDSVSRLAAGNLWETLYTDSTTTSGIYWAPSAKSVLNEKGALLSAQDSNGTLAKLAPGSNNQVLTADSTTATGLKWTTPAAGGYTSIATGSLSGSTVNITSISGSYTDLYLVIKDLALSADGDFSFRYNNDTTANRHSIYGGTTIVGGSSNTVVSTGTSIKLNYNTIDSPDADNQFVLRVNNYSVAQKHSGSVWSVYTAGTNAQEFYYGWTGYTDTVAITEINLFTNQTFSGGTYILYGVK